MKRRAVILKGPLVDPLPGHPSPLAARISPLIRAYPAEAFQAMRQGTPRTNAAEDALSALAALNHGDRETAHRLLESAFAWPDNSVFVSAIDWNACADEKRVRSLGPQIVRRLREIGGIDADIFVKSYADPLRVLRVAYLCKALYRESLHDAAIPLVEEIDYTMRDGVPHSTVSISSGEDVMAHVLRTRASASEEERLRDAIREHTHRLSDHLNRDDRLRPLFSGTASERYGRKSLENALLLADAASSGGQIAHAAAGCRDAAAMALRMAADRDLFLYDLDPKAQNFTLAGDRVRNIDLEKAVALRLHPAHLFAHVWFSPWRHLSIDARISGTVQDAGRYGGEALAFDAIYYYLQRQVAISKVGVYVPFPDDKAQVRATVRSHIDAFRRVAALPQVAREYRCAERYAGIDPDAFMAAVRFIPGQNVKGAGSSSRR